jgi:chromosome segregation ATPase
MSSYLLNYNVTKSKNDVLVAPCDSSSSDCESRQQALQAENDELRARLRELEETVQATSQEEGNCRLDGGGRTKLISIMKEETDTAGMELETLVEQIELLNLEGQRQHQMTSELTQRLERSED